MSEHHISPAYAEQLASDYSPDNAQAIDTEWRTAELALQPEQHIEYVRLGAETAEPNGKPVLFVYGYTAGIVANAPFGAAMAARGFDIIIPNQNRDGLLKNPDGKRDATYTQAMNMAAIIARENLTHTPLNVVTHSYGSLIFDSLADYANQAGWYCFDNSRVAMLAPSGVKEDEQTAKFLKRYVALFRAGGKLEKFEDSYWAHEKEMFAAGQAHFMANKGRALREGREIIQRRLNLRGMVTRGVGEIALVPFAEDALFSQDALAASIGHLISDKVTSFSPVSLEIDAKGLRSGRGADHSDQQFNPERVADSIAQYLRS